MFYPPVWVVWWSRRPVGPRLADGRASALGRARRVRARAIDAGQGRWAATVAAASLPGLAISPGPHVRGPLSARLGGLLVSLGLLGLRPACDGPAARAAVLARHPGPHVPDGPSAGMVSPGPGLVGLEPVRRPDSLACAGPRRAAVQLLAWAGVAGLVDRPRGRRRRPAAGRPALAARAITTPRVGVEIPRRYHLQRLNAFQLLSPTALGGPSDYFGDDNYWETLFSIGLVPLFLAVLAALRHPDRKLVRGWLVLAGLAVWFACGRHLVSLRSSYLAGARHELVPRAGAVALPRQSRPARSWPAWGSRRFRIRMTDPCAWRRFALRRGRDVFVMVVGLLLDRGGHSTSHGPSRTAEAARRVLDDGCFWFTLGGMAGLLVVGCLRCHLEALVWRARSSGCWRLRAGLAGVRALPVAPAERFVGDDPVGEALLRLDRDSPRSGRVRIKARDSFYGDLPAVAAASRRRISTTSFSSIMPRGSTRLSIRSRRGRAGGVTSR